MTLSQQTLEKPGFPSGFIDEMLEDQQLLANVP